MFKRFPENVALFLLVSAVLHGLIMLYLTLNSRAPSVGPQGIVEISLIEPISHMQNETVLPRPAPRTAKPKTEASAEPAMPSAEPQAQTTPPAPGGDKTADPQTTAFITSVTRLVERARIYPRDSLRREEEGKVTVAVTLNRNGELLDAKVEEPCPFDSLNQAALKTVRSVRAYPVVPDSLPAPVHLHIPLLYRVER